ncbi:MAG TPA: ABC transporter permease [Acidobacteriaceae bacterium]|jgi:predicted permease|nr:ABC transporter permease [Acidobacteriaceae bacterium]
MFSDLRVRFRSLFRSTTVTQEIDEELQFHLGQQMEKYLRAGLTPDQAKRRIRLEFGGATQIKEDCQEARGISFVEHIEQDVRYAMRMFRRTPGFTVVVVITLALGIGANTAVFSLINAVLLKMLPVKNPEQLVQFSKMQPLYGEIDGFSYPELERFQHETRTFSGLLAFADLGDVNVEANGRGEIANGQVVSGSYFSTLGVSAILGRTISPADDQGSTVAVISYKYWRERLAGDPAVVGKKIVINNYPFSIIGVTPPEFFGLQPGQAIDVSVPLKMIAQLRPEYAMIGTPYDVLTWPTRSAFLIMGRLRPGVTATIAAARIEPLFRDAMNEEARGLAGTPLDSQPERENRRQARLQVSAGGRGLAALRERFSKPLWILMAAVGLLLLIACANVATLLLARAQFRQHEMAARLVLGARRLRLMQQLITEGILLALAGGVLGIVLAFWASGSLMALMRHMGTPIVLSVQPDLRVLGFTLAISVLTAILFAWIPAHRLVRTDMGLAPNVHGAGKSAGRSHTTKTLITLQVAASLVLMVGAGLLVRSLQNLKSFYPGFRTDNVLLFDVNARLLGYTVPQTNALYRRLTDQIDALPGIRRTSFSMNSPFSGGFGEASPTIEGYQPASGSPPLIVDLNTLGPHYFETLETPILLGRDFTGDDSANAPKVAIINQRLAHEIFAGTSPIGRRLSIPTFAGDKSWYSIVGVVADAKSEDLREAVKPTIYVPTEQTVVPAGVTFAVRTAKDAAAEAPAVLHAVAQVDGRLSLSGMKTLNDQMDESLLQERLVASLAGLFGILAVLLASVGLYGVMAYTVSRKTNEIGIRMALGSRRIQIAGLVLREALLMVVAGLLLGIPAALATGRLMRSQLYGLGPYDPMTVLFAVGLMTVVAVLACYLPATRAMRVDPMAALRYE